MSSASSWEANVEKIIQFAEEHKGYIQGFLAEQFSLSPVAEITLQTDSNAGNIRINDTDITTGTKGVTDVSLWRGEYFAGTTQTLTAVTLGGHPFIKFIVTDPASGKKQEYTSSSIEVMLGSEGTSVQAVFE